MKGVCSTRELISCLRSTSLGSPCQHLHHHRPRLHILPTQRNFHPSPHTQQKRRPKYRNITRDELDETVAAQRAKQYKPYSEAEMVSVRAKYSKEQLAAIEAGEAAISPIDLANQAALRRDPFTPQYLDDFSRIEPVIDKKIEKIRGEEQDYEKAVQPFHVPDMPEDFITLHELRVDDEHVGHWKPSLDRKGDEVLVYMGREHELDYFAEKYFRETPECLEMVRQKMDNLDHPAVPHQTIEELEVEHAEHLEAEKRAQEMEQDEPDEPEEDASEEDNSEQRRVEEASQPPDGPVEAAVEFAIDYTSHPKYQEIRARLVAEGPMRRKYGFGSTEPQRAMQRVIEGVEPDVAPELPKIEDPTVIWETSATDAETDTDAPEEDVGGLEDDALAAYKRVAKVLSQPVAQLLRYRMKTLVQHQVTNQTRLGKINSVYSLVVAGNMNGMVGLGEGKASEHAESERMAKLNAIRNMVPVLRYENRTIYGDIEGKSGATVVKLNARRPGFGVRTNAHIFEIARCAGLQDLAARVPRSRNHMNMAKATFKALQSQRDPDEIARGRGKKMVDVRKVYYSGLV